MKAYAIDLPCPACEVSHTYYYVQPDPAPGGEAPILEWESYNHLVRVSELTMFRPEGMEYLDCATPWSKVRDYEPPTPWRRVEGDAT